MAWEVAQICEICEAHGWVKPVVYQGIYNALNRTVEAELFPCLRHYGMGFYAYNPLGGGFFTGTFKKESEVEKGSRFDPNKWQGKMYRAKYFRDEYFQALDIVKPAAEKYGLAMAEVALRWMTHHSQLGQKYPDAILTGASRLVFSVPPFIDQAADTRKYLAQSTSNRTWSIWIKDRFQMMW